MGELFYSSGGSVCPLGRFGSNKKCQLGIILADPTRLELATSAVTGQRSNQLSYESNFFYYNVLSQKTQQQNAGVCLCSEN